MKKWFSSNEINTGRQDELDIVKGLAIIFMVWCHVFDSLGGDRTTPIGFLVDCVLGLFWKTNENAYFTLFHWFAYPVIGCIFGEYLRRCIDKKAVYKLLMLVFPVTGLIEFGAYFLGFGLAGDTVQYFYMNPVNIVFCISLAAAWTGIWYLLHEKFPNIRIGYLQKLSKHINNIYCIHWVMIGIACIIKEFTWKDSTFGMLPATLIAALFLVASEWIADWYTKKKKEIKE